MGKKIFLITITCIILTLFVGVTIGGNEAQQKRDEKARIEQQIKNQPRKVYQQISVTEYKTKAKELMDRIDILINDFEKSYRLVSGRTFGEDKSAVIPAAKTFEKEILNINTEIIELSSSVDKITIKEGKNDVPITKDLLEAVVYLSEGAHTLQNPNHAVSWTHGTDRYYKGVTGLRFYKDKLKKI